eukprot:4067-Pelagococcus_subviridis.AAC.2
MHRHRREQLEERDDDFSSAVAVVRGFDLPDALVRDYVAQEPPGDDDALRRYFRGRTRPDGDLERLRLDAHVHVLGRDAARDGKLEDDLALGLLPPVPVRDAAALLRGEVLHPPRAVLAHVPRGLQTRHVHRGLSSHLRGLLLALRRERLAVSRGRRARGVHHVRRDRRVLVARARDRERARESIVRVRRDASRGEREGDARCRRRRAFGRRHRARLVTTFRVALARRDKTRRRETQDSRATAIPRNARVARANQGGILKENRRRGLKIGRRSARFSFKF